MAADAVSLHCVIAKSAERETLRHYTFDRCCGPATSQAAFFDACGVSALIDNALAGINATIFAYGAAARGGARTRRPAF